MADFADKLHPELEEALNLASVELRRESGAPPSADAIQKVREIGRELQRGFDRESTVEYAVRALAKLEGNAIVTGFFKRGDGSWGQSMVFDPDDGDVDYIELIDFLPRGLSAEVNLTDHPSRAGLDEFDFVDPDIDTGQPYLPSTLAEDAPREDRINTKATVLYGLASDLGFEDERLQNQKLYVLCARAHSAYRGASKLPLDDTSHGKSELLGVVVMSKQIEQAFSERMFEISTLFPAVLAAQLRSLAD